MNNNELMKAILNLEDGASEQLRARIKLLTEGGKLISHDKAKSIGALLYTISSTFASGAVFLSAEGVEDSLRKRNILPDQGELATYLIRQMFSARDNDPEGKNNYQLLQRLLKVIYFPHGTTEPDVTTVFVNDTDKLNSVKELRKVISTAMRSRKRGAVMCALIEYYTPVLIELISLAFTNGQTSDQRMTISQAYRKDKQRDREATLYLDKHKNLDARLGYHVFRSLLQPNEYYLITDIGAEFVPYFVDVINDFQKKLIIRTAGSKF